MDFDLVFEGGGAKGMVFVGAMQEFEARGHKCGRLLGTSAGAITATLLYLTRSLIALFERAENEGIARNLRLTDAWLMFHPGIL